MKAGLRTDKRLVDLYYWQSRPFPFSAFYSHEQWKQEKYTTYLPLRGQYRDCLKIKRTCFPFHPFIGTFTRTAICISNPFAEI
jgi:hypothetical protein